MALTNIETNIILDLYDYDTTPTKIKAIQLDSNTRYVSAVIRNRSGIYDVGQTTGVTLTIIRPDKVGVQITGEPVAHTETTPDQQVITTYGVYAELSLVALAVKGNLKAQFMLKSGDQVLRTEIFTISCGEALDASTDTWAGEYQGYNLDELVQNVNSAVATVEGMEQDVSELKSGLTQMTTATAEDVGKALKAKTVADGKVTSWEFGTIDMDTVIDVESMDGMTDAEKIYRFGGEIYYHNGTEWVKIGTESGGASTDDSYGRDVVKIPNIVIDPMFKDLTNTDAISITNATCESDGDGVLQCSVTRKTFKVLVKVADTESTDILFYSIKVAPVGYRVNVKPITTSQTLVADGTTEVIDGVTTGGTGKVIYVGFENGSVTMTTTITMPIVVNLTAVFGAGHEPTYTEFKSMLDNWTRDEFGEFISKQKYDALISYPKLYAQNLLVKTANSTSVANDTVHSVVGTGSADFIKSKGISVPTADYSFDGDVIYLAMMAKASGSPTKLSLSHSDLSAAMKEVDIQTMPTADEWYRLSSIDKQVSASVPDYRYVQVRVDYADSAAQNGQTLTYKCGLAFNLTTIFGKGNEPTDPTVIDAMLSQYENGWFSGSHDIWNPSLIKWLAESYKSYMNGTYYGSDGKRFVAGSTIDRYDSQWDHTQSTYGLSNTVVPVDNSFEGGIRTNGMVNIFPKYGRWEQSANNAGASGVSLFGGHVFEAWNNIRSYRLTMMMGHGGDKVSYTDDGGNVHATAREDEACIIVYSPANSYANPPVTPTEEQSKLRINKAQEDYYGDSSTNMLGRVRIGGDTPTQGTVFTKNKMITYGRIILADTSQTNKGKQLVFNNDGTITWTEVDLYQHPEPAPTE